jgi:hypothetical protein
LRLTLSNRDQPAKICRLIRGNHHSKIDLLILPPPPPMDLVL